MKMDMALSTVNIQKHNGWFLYQCNISGLQSWFNG